MRMADDGVFDLARIEPHLLHTRVDFVFDGIVEDRIEHNDAVRCLQIPVGILVLAKPVQIFERLHRFAVPGRAIWRPAALSTPAAATGTSWRCTRRSLSAGRRSGSCALTTATGATSASTS